MEKADTLTVLEYRNDNGQTKQKALGLFWYTVSWGDASSVDWMNEQLAADALDLKIPKRWPLNHVGPYTGLSLLKN